MFISRKNCFYWMALCWHTWGLCEYIIAHTNVPPNPVILWIELGGKPKWLPLIFGYHDVMHTGTVTTINLIFTHIMVLLENYSEFRHNHHFIVITNSQPSTVTLHKINRPLYFIMPGSINYLEHFFQHHLQPIRDSVLHDICRSKESFWYSWYTEFFPCSNEWGLRALCHGIQNSMEAILTCHPVLSTEWLGWVEILLGLWLSLPSKPHWSPKASILTNVNGHTTDIVRSVSICATVSSMKRKSNHQTPIGIHHNSNTAKNQHILALSECLW